MHQPLSQSTSRPPEERPSFDLGLDWPEHRVSTQRTHPRGEERRELEAHRVRPDERRRDLEVGAKPSRDESPLADAHLLLAPDRSALTTLYIRYANLVRRVALAVLRSREEAEDLTHEVFVILCGPTTYDPSRGSVRAFLTTLTRSRALDRLRNRARSTRLLETCQAAPAPAPTTPFEQLAEGRTAERVRAALAELPGAQREIVEMAYDRGLSQREIAGELETPLGTVKCRSRRALLALGRALEEFVE